MGRSGVYSKGGSVRKIALLVALAVLIASIFAATGDPLSGYGHLGK